VTVYLNGLAADFPAANITIIQSAVASTGLIIDSGRGLWSYTTGTTASSPWLQHVDSVTRLGGDYCYREYIGNENDDHTNTPVGGWAALAAAMYQRELTLTGRLPHQLVGAYGITGPDTTSVGQAFPSADIYVNRQRGDNILAGQAYIPARICEDHAAFPIAFGFVYCASQYYGAFLAPSSYQTFRYFAGLGGGRGIGPHAVRMSAHGNTIFIGFAHENGFNLTYRNTDRLIDGFQITDNVGTLTITANQIIGNNRLMLTVNRPVSAGLVVAYGAFAGFSQFTVLPSNPITTNTTTPTSVQIHWPSHPMNVGDYFMLDGVATVGGIVAGNIVAFPPGNALSSEWQVASVVDANNITITVPSSIQATSAATGGGATCNVRPSNFLFDDSALVPGGFPVRQFTLTGAAAKKPGNQVAMVA
jgi:hypothetical protein